MGAAACRPDAESSSDLIHPICTVRRAHPVDQGSQNDNQVTWVVIFAKVVSASASSGADPASAPPISAGRELAGAIGAQRLVTFYPP